MKEPLALIPGDKINAVNLANLIKKFTGKDTPPEELAEMQVRLDAAFAKARAAKAAKNQQPG